MHKVHRFHANFEKIKNRKKENGFFAAIKRNTKQRKEIRRNFKCLLAAAAAACCQHHCTVASASAAQRLHTTNQCVANKLFSIAQNDCRFQRSVRCARVCRCDIFYVCALCFAFSRDRMSHFLNPILFFFWSRLSSHAYADCTNSKNRCFPSVAYIYFLPNNIISIVLFAT